jgi:hypothetical protein
MRESVELLNNLSEELREEYSVIEARRNAYEQAVEAARRNGQDPPDPDEDVDLRTMDELQAELELQEANLEMNTNTNPGVVEQYEKRKRDVSRLSYYAHGGTLMHPCRLPRLRRPWRAVNAMQTRSNARSRMLEYVASAYDIAWCLRMISRTTGSRPCKSLSLASGRSFPLHLTVRPRFIATGAPAHCYF